MLELSDNGFFCGSVLFDVGVALTSKLAVRVDGRDDDVGELTVDIGVSRLQPSSVEHCSLVDE